MSSITYPSRPEERLMPSRFENSMPMQRTVYTDSTYALAEQDAFRDRLRAALAKQIMDNVAALSNAESYYLKISPGGAEEYRRIIHIYTELALVKLIDCAW